MFTNKREEEFFMNHLNNDQKVLEWGSGESTIQISIRGKEIISIEHQSQWFDSIMQRKPDNVYLYLGKPNLPYREGGHDGTYEEFKDYCDFPLDKGPFDIILIDGRARVKCAENALKLCHEKTLIFIHDFDRVDLHVVCDFLEKISCQGTMCSFRPKKQPDINIKRETSGGLNE